MPRSPSSVYREITIHVIAWLIYLVIQVLAIDQFENRHTENFLSALAQLPAQLIFTYIMLYWLIPTYLLRGRQAMFGLLTLLVVVVCGILYWQGTYYLFIRWVRPGEVARETPWNLGMIVLSAFYMLCTSGLLIAFHMIRYGFRQQRLNQQLVIANQSVELKSLRDQINPHFLFNTLNNLYGLTSSNPDKAGEVVLRLSQLMQYMLYEGNLPTVPLRKEIDYLTNYLALEQIRYGDDLQLSFVVKGPVEGVSIAPLLLLPFVENAFKHGLSRQLRDAWLQIQLTVTDNELIFKVENSKPETPVSASPRGIGLPNVAKRLDLIYPGQHRLRQLDGTDTYLITLTVYLTKPDSVQPTHHEDHLPAGR